MTVETIIEFERETYKELCSEMRDVLQLEKELVARKEELRKQIVEMAGGDRMENGIKVTKRSSKGSVDYKGMVENLYTEDQLEGICEAWRKSGREYWEVRSY